MQEVFTRKIFAHPRAGLAERHPGHHRRRHLCGAGPVPRRQAAAPGFIRQEQIALPDFLANRFGAVYA
jgi:hypothetical protein